MALLNAQHIRHSMKRRGINNRSTPTIAVIFLLPYIVGVGPNPADSSSQDSTEVTFAVGRGMYANVSRDCSGKVLGVSNVPFEDGRVEIKRSSGVVNFGGGIGIAHLHEDRDYQGYLESPDQTVYYINPMIGLNTHWVGLDVGPLWFTDYNPKIEMQSIPSISLRLGVSNVFYFSSSFARNMPMFSGGGMFDVGFGFNAGAPGSSLWLGFGALPYDGAVFLGKLETPVSERFILAPRAMVGLGTGSQFGLSIGGKIVF